MTSWLPTGLDNATAHAVELEEDGQVVQDGRLCHESEPSITSKQPVRAQESCCAGTLTFFVIARTRSSNILLRQVEGLQQADVGTCRSSRQLRGST
jgi:hypothetical protein